MNYRAFNFILFLPSYVVYKVTSHNWMESLAAYSSYFTQAKPQPLTGKFDTQKSKRRKFTKVSLKIVTIRGGFPCLFYLPGIPNPHIILGIYLDILISTSHH